eukprot:g41237.t1
MGDQWMWHIGFPFDKVPHKSLLHKIKAHGVGDNINIDQGWVHVVCALYVPGVAFGDIDRLRPVTLTEMNYSKYGAKECSLCEDMRFARTGVCVSCDADAARPAELFQQLLFLFQFGNFTWLTPHFQVCLVLLLACRPAIPFEP